MFDVTCNNIKSQWYMHCLQVSRAAVEMEPELDQDVAAAHPVDLEDLADECGTLSSDDEAEEEENLRRNDLLLLQQKSYKLLLSLM